MMYIDSILIQERSIISGTATTLVAPLVDFYTPLLPFFMLAIVIVICDCRFGVEAAIKRKEEIRQSRKWRRSINKLMDYICWVTLAGLFGGVFGTILGIPVLSVLILLLIYGIEVMSCFNNYFEARGIKKRINIFKLFNRPELDECVEDLEENNEVGSDRN